MAEFIIGLLWQNYFKIFTEALFCARYYSLLYLRYKNEKDILPLRNSLSGGEDRFKKSYKNVIEMNLGGTHT